MPRRLLTIGFAACLVLAGAEAGARVLEQELEPTSQWPVPEIGAKVEQLRAIDAAGEQVDVAFVGASTVKWGVDAAVVSEVVGQPAYNAGLGGLPMDATRLWSEHFVLPLLRPSFLVIGVTEVDINDAGFAQQANSRKFLDATGVGRTVNAGSPGVRLTTWVERWSALFRLRTTLRDPTWVTSEDEPARNVPVGVDGSMVQHPRLRFFLGDGFEDVVFPRLVQEYELRGELIGQLRELVLLAEEAGATPLVVRMPFLHEHTDPLFEHGIDDVEEGRRALEDLTTELDVPYLDANDFGFGVDHFFDPVHLNPRGRAEFSLELGTWIRGLPR